MADPACQLGGRFSRCTRASKNTCQYCGRHFCAEHAYVDEGIDAVCTRNRCRTKFDDLRRHLQYRQRVQQRNSAGLCGLEGCGPHPAFECSLCNGLFCEAHVSNRLYPFREAFSSSERPVSVCEWCWKRRKIWRRR
ncbi:MAG: hypothetical protein ACM3S1_16650 [Hyphomicrobiales bacterium]